MDLSDQMLHMLDGCLSGLPNEVQAPMAYQRMDVVAHPWPIGFDFVILGANCFYELASGEEQETCIAAAANALWPGGYLCLDNDHIEGELDPSWCTLGVQEAFPMGVCSDGTRVSGTSETIWYDVARRLVRFQRTATVQTLEGRVFSRECIQQQHPPSTSEMVAWLEGHGFTIVHLWRDRHRSTYTDQ